MPSHPPPPSILAAFFVACSGNYPRAGGNELGRTPNAGPSGEASRSVPGAPSSAGSAPGLRSSAPSAAVNVGGRESRRHAENNEVSIVWEGVDLEKMKATLGSSEAAEAKARHTVIDPIEIYIEVEDGT